MENPLLQPETQQGLARAYDRKRDMDFLETLEHEAGMYNLENEKPPKVHEKLGLVLSFGIKYGGPLALALQALALETGHRVRRLFRNPD